MNFASAATLSAAGALRNVKGASDLATVAPPVQDGRGPLLCGCRRHRKSIRETVKTILNTLKAARPGAVVP